VPAQFAKDDAKEARASIERIRGLGETHVCLTHFGASTDVDGVARQLHAWIDRADAWVEEAALGTESVAAITERLRTAWRKAIAHGNDARKLGFGEADWALLATDIDLNAQGLAVAAELKRNPPPPRAT
jgi:hypothetical protein